MCIHLNCGIQAISVLNAHPLHLAEASSRKDNTSNLHIYWGSSKQMDSFKRGLFFPAKSPSNIF